MTELQELCNVLASEIKRCFDSVDGGSRREWDYIQYSFGYYENRLEVIKFHWEGLDEAIHTVTRNVYDALPFLKSEEVTKDNFFEKLREHDINLTSDLELLTIRIWYEDENYAKKTYTVDWNGMNCYDNDKYSDFFVAISDLIKYLDTLKGDTE